MTYQRKHSHYASRKRSTDCDLLGNFLINRHIHSFYMHTNDANGPSAARSSTKNISANIRNISLHVPHTRTSSHFHPDVLYRGFAKPFSVKRLHRLPLGLLSIRKHKNTIMRFSVALNSLLNPISKYPNYAEMVPPCGRCIW